MKYALDTNIIVDMVNQIEPVMARFHESIANRMDFVIPVAVDYEIMRGFHHRPSKKKETIYEMMRRYCPVVEVNLAVWKRAASLWGELERAGKRIGDADTIIAAHCLVNDYTLITNNTSDFERVKGLLLVKWV